MSASVASFLQHPFQNSPRRLPIRCPVQLLSLFVTSLLHPLAGGHLTNASLRWRSRLKAQDSFLILRDVCHEPGVRLRQLIVGADQGLQRRIRRSSKHNWRSGTCITRRARDSFSGQCLGHRGGSRRLLGRIVQN